MHLQLIIRSNKCTTLETVAAGYFGRDTYDNARGEEFISVLFS